MLDEANGSAPVADAASPVASDATPAPAATIRDTLAEVASKYYPAREIGTGRFAGDAASDDAEPATDAAPAEAAPAAPETTDQPETKATETAATPSIEPPASWSADVKAKWAALPPDVQQYIARRESEAHQAITQAGGKAKAYEAIEGVIGPRRQALVATWGNEAAAMEQLFNLSDFATRDPAGFVTWFAQQNRVDLSRLNPAPANAEYSAQQATAPTVADPEARAAIAQMQRAAVESDIQAFASAKGPDGEPLRPFFDDVRVEMGRLMQAQIATSLDEAYAKAIRTNDAVWSKVQAAEAAKAAKAAEEAQAKQREAAAKAAKEAQRASSLNVKATGAVSGAPAKPRTMRDTMEAVIRQHYGAA